MRDILTRRSAFAGSARLSAYRLEVAAYGALHVSSLHVDSADQADTD